MLYQLRDKVRKSNRLKRIVYPIYGFFFDMYNRNRSKKIYRDNKRKYTSMNNNSNFEINEKYNYPMYSDRFQKAGTLGQYFWQDLWAAKLINQNNPEKHYDIGSRVDGFIGHLASFRENIVLIDVRPLNDVIPGVSFFRADATMLKGIGDNSVESLSALCSLEHFGLGRYGDPIDPDACFKAFASIVRVMKQGGHAYIAVPIGKEHLEFDAHRVFYASTIIECFKPMKCIEFSCIDAQDLGIEKNVPVNKYDNDESLGGARFGLFHFIL